MKRQEIVDQYDHMDRLLLCIKGQMDMLQDMASQYGGPLEVNRESQVAIAVRCLVDAVRAEMDDLMQCTLPAAVPIASTTA